MTAPFFPAGFRATDDNDNPLAGGQYRYFAAGGPRAIRHKEGHERGANGDFRKRRHDGERWLWA